MVFHYIAIASGFQRGQRVAWHYPSEEKLDQERISSFIKKSLEYDSAQFGIHKLSTSSTKWSSVVEKDSFFADILATQSEEELFRILSEDKKILAMDVAAFIIGLKPMSHLKLQKLLYLTYASFLEKYQEPLFGDEIISYRYGPVVEAVYQEFKKYGVEEITEKEKYSFFLKSNSYPALFMRISNSDKGSRAIETIISTIEKYSDLTASQLVNITHCENSPWSNSYTGAYKNDVITDETINKYHKFEKNHSIAKRAN